MYKKFVNLLVENNKTAYQISKETGISQSTLSNWKSGRSNPKIDKLQKLAKYFNVPLEYFIEEVDSNKLGGEADATRNGEVF